jgi:hypothetical protein
MNLSISALTSVAHASSLQSVFDEEPGCGTKPPGWHPPRPGGSLLEALMQNPSALERLAINPQPLPPEQPA